MDELIDRFTQDTGIKIEQQRIPWADLYAKLQVVGAGRRGPGPGADPHRRGPALRQRRRAGGDRRRDGSPARASRARTTCPPTWQGGTFQGKRYSLPLDVPQHMLYLNVKVMKDAGLVGADGKPKVPASRDELVTMAKQITKGDTFGFAHRHGEPGQVHLGLPQPALAERRQHLRERSQAAGVDGSGRARGRRVLGRAARTSTRSCRRPTPTAAMPSSRATASACGSPARGTSPACARPRWTSSPRRCRASSSSRSCGRCRTSTPSPRRRRVDRAKRDAAWTHVRWMTDHVAEWTLKAGQVSASRKAPHRPARHRRPGAAHAARPGAELAGRPADAQVGRGGERHAAGDRERSTPARSRPRRRWRSWRKPDQRAARLTA